MDSHQNRNHNKCAFIPSPIYFSFQNIWPQYLTILCSHLALCSLDCGDNGQCQGSGCVCQKGWEGDRCQHRSCDPRCSLHGQCKNGSCVCQTGFNGKHCTLPACNHPTGVRHGKNCNGHGTCKRSFAGGIGAYSRNKDTTHHMESIVGESIMFTNDMTNQLQYR